MLANMNHAAEFLNGKIWLPTGTAGSGTTAASTNALEIYDIATNTWTAGAQLISFVVYLYAVVLPRRIPNRCRNRTLA